MVRTVSIGKQSFERIIQENCFYVDKTGFIRDWWVSGDDVTLITRPRRFGKTLNLDMVKCFFANKYAGRQDLFEGLDIWQEGKYRDLQGSYPVIFLSFANVKKDTYAGTVEVIKRILYKAYQEFAFLSEWDGLTEAERYDLQHLSYHMSDVAAQMLLNNLCDYLHRYYGKKAIVLLDEYDTPMQEAYVYGYWQELVSFTRTFFNSTFKTNPHLERAIMTGITRVSKESLFSDLNNLRVITVTSDTYAQYFGFTEQEVFAALDEYGLSEQKCLVKQWYDGFTFGKTSEIYNPWSIINFLREKKVAAYWVATSSNGLVNQLIRQGSTDVKQDMETLLVGGSIKVKMDEQIVFSALDYSDSAVWSLLLASGYLKAVSVEMKYGAAGPSEIYELTVTNLEVRAMFSSMIFGWFENVATKTNAFVKAMLIGDLEAMNDYMNAVAMQTFNIFDTGKNPSDSHNPENFYHGFVLGLMVDLEDTYHIRSNRESGFGRYDIMLEPKDMAKYPGIVIEFKVFNARREKSLEDTVEIALKQIREKNYAAELISRGVPENNIRQYGFAFRGKEVLIGM